VDAVESMAADGALYVRITCTDGTTGVGEATFFTWPQAVGAIVDAFAPGLRGADPFDTEHHSLRLLRGASFRGMAVNGAISAIDQALWDIKGKLLDEPVWQLLGGRVRDGVRAMRVIAGASAEELCAAGARAVEDGYTAVKALVFGHEHHAMPHARRLDDLVARTGALRDTVGPDVDIAIELHRNMGPADSLTLMDRIERFSPIFVEDPIPPDSVLSLGEIARKARIPLAAGERNTTIWEFREYIEAAGIEVVRPDIGVAGGITGVRKIAAMAQAHHLLIAPHAVPSGPVATAAHVQAGVASPGWEWQEYVPQADDPRCRDVVDAVVSLRDGWLLPADRPGLGIELDDAGLAAHPAGAFGGDAAVRRGGEVAFR
jgi:galactonate dehydratase